MAAGAFNVLKNRNFALLWSAGVVSSVGTWMQIVAVAALITELTDQAFWGGLVGGVSYLATGLITPFGGIWADRYNRRVLMIVASVAESFLALGIAFLYINGDASPLVLTIVTALEGVFLAVAMPARQALLPDIVPREQIATAASLSFASYNLGRVVGPALGGLFIAFGSYSWVFVFNAATFLGVVLATYLVRLPAHKAVTITSSVWQRMKEGYRGARNEPGCWAAVKTVAVLALLVSPFIALVPAMAQIELGGTPVDTAHLVTGQGVGAVAGAFIFPVLIKRFGRRRATLGNLFALPIITAAYAFAPSLPLAIGALTLLGASYVAVLSGLSATMQTRAPIEVRARVIAVFSTALNVAYPLGAAAQGFLSDQLNVRIILAGGALLFLAYALYQRLSRPASLYALASDG